MKFKNVCTRHNIANRPAAGGVAAERSEVVGHRLSTERTRRETAGEAEGYIESLHDKFRDERLNREVFGTLAEARVIIDT